MTDCCNAIAANGEAGSWVLPYRVNAPRAGYKADSPGAKRLRSAPLPPLSPPSSYKQSPRLWLVDDCVTEHLTVPRPRADRKETEKLMEKRFQPPFGSIMQYYT